MDVLKEDGLSMWEAIKKFNKIDYIVCVFMVSVITWALWMGFGD